MISLNTALLPLHAGWSYHLILDRFIYGDYVHCVTYVGPDLQKGDLPGGLQVVRARPREKSAFRNPRNATQNMSKVGDHCVFHRLNMPHSLKCIPADNPRLHQAGKCNHNTKLSG